MKNVLLSSLVLLGSIAHGQVVINEVCAANADVIIEQGSGNFLPWLELHNRSNSAADVSWFMLSDDPAQPAKWLIPGNSIIPAKGYLLIWCDGAAQGYHAGFSLSAKGETIVLSTSAGAELDRVSYPEQYTNTSFARTSDGAATWKYSSAPSPAGSNSNSVESTRIAPPTFSKSAGRYPGSVTLTLSHSSSGVDIRYTTNGSEPTQSSLKYNGTITLSSTRVVKAKAFHRDHLPSETVAATYLIGEHATTLPVISISANPDYLWDNTIGIYTDGTNGIPGNCNGNNMNWNQDWDRHAVFEYFSPTGLQQVSQHVDIRIGGACSRNFPQKSFVIQAKRKYGDNDIDFNFFPSKPKVDKFDGLFLRNAGNDFNTAMFRDAFFQSLGIGQMDLDYMAYQPTAFYLNGEYWGIQNLREKIDGGFIQSNYGIDKNDVDLLETWENAIEGDNAAWVTYKATLATLNPTDPSTFDFIDAHIDVQEYINYLVTEIYVANTDWPGNNIKFWRQRSTNGKFRWILWDLDFGFGLYGTPFDHPTLNFATDTNGPGWPNPPWSTEHIRLVLQNPEFRNRFIAAMATAMSTTFHPDRINSKLDEFAVRIGQEVPYHKQRWGGTMSDWQYEIQRLRDFSVQRHAFMQSHVATFFGTNALKFTLGIDPANTGTAMMNGVKTGPFIDATFYNAIPYLIKAKPNAGFKFTGWSVTTRESETISLTTPGSLWKYFDQGMLPSATWALPAYNDGGWAQGNAELGYGDGGEATVVSFGPDANNKYITTYFRKSFNLTDTIGFSGIAASVLFDDGVVVYLNGAEVYRNNMPVGAIDYNTLASATIPVENAFYPFTIPKGILKPGLNTWAVEVHQAGVASSDISFDFQASVSRNGNIQSKDISQVEVYDTAYSDITMVAHFEPIAPIDGLVLNEMSASKSFAKDEQGEADDWIELYNAGNNAIDISGLMVTDDLNLKGKFTLNSETPWVLQPGQYQLLWADGQPEQGANHLPFKLSSDGESIGIYHAAGFDTAVIAEIEFGFMMDGFSLSRIPNGSGPFTLTNALTPSAANAAGELFSIFPNPTSGTVNIITNEASTTVVVFNSMGSKVSSFRIEANQVVPIDIGHLSDGIYLVKLISPAGEKKSRLVVVSQ